MLHWFRRTLNRWLHPKKVACYRHGRTMEATTMSTTYVDLMDTS